MLHTITLKQAIDGVKQKKFSLSELHADTLTAAQEAQQNYNIFVSEPRAQEVNNALISTPLAGAPIAVKDNCLTQGQTTTASSKVLESFSPAYSATVVEKIQTAGGVVFGKTNMDAWAHGSSTETSDYGTTKNPRNPAHSPGGSSGGSAAAVAANACIAAIGTETAGSIRLPAAWCGVVGLKPTYGRVSRYGIVAMASSTDSPGSITKTVEDAAIMLTHMAGNDPLDGTTSSQSVPDFTSFLGKNIQGLKIGFMYEDLAGLESILDHYHDVISVLETLGATVKAVSALDPHYAISVYTIIQRGEVSSNLARYDGIRYGHDRSYFGAEAQRRIMLGTYTLSKGYADQYYTLAQKVRTLFRQDFEKLFEEYDVLIAPTTPSFAPKIGIAEGQAMFGELADMLQEPSSLTGLPGINIPCFRDTTTNLFLGLNIIAPLWREDLLLQVADAYEKATEWNSWRSHA